MAVPTWAPAIASAVFGTTLILSLPYIIPHPAWNEEIKVAFIGNSMMYFNDLPRLMEALSQGAITQNSCLRPRASLRKILTLGSGVYSIFNSTNAYIGDAGVYDFGACTVPQLLFGKDDDITNNDHEDDTALQWLNPCYVDEGYLEYLEGYYSNDDNSPSWDFIVMNDQTTTPAKVRGRNYGLQILESTYIPWFQETGAIPVFIHTRPYWKTGWENMTSVGGSIPIFASLTYEGYRQYAELVAENLPDSQKPRIAPVGIAFLTVWEENFNMWEKLFYTDGVHASPHGTFLQGCVLYYTLYGRMPLPEVLEDMESLWSLARFMQPTGNSLPIPTLEEAKYLYYIAQRVTQYGHKPKSFITYENGEALYNGEIVTGST